MIQRRRTFALLFGALLVGAQAPVPTRLHGISVEASERIWMNLPPARVWVYRKG